MTSIVPGIMTPISLQFQMARAFDDYGNLVTADYRICKRYFNTAASSNS